MNEQQKNLNMLVERLEKHQAALKLNDVQFVARFRRHLGSTRSWRQRLCGRAWDEIGTGIDKWVRRLAALIAEIEGGSATEVFYHNLPIAEYCASVYQLLQGQANDRRNAFLIGPTGVGKSYALKSLFNANPARCAYAFAHKGWSESIMRISIGLARAVGAPEKLGGAATFDAVIEHLRANPVTLIVEDAHEGGVLMMKLIKTIIDSTRSRVITGTYPTAWKKLVNSSTDAIAEARQLIGRSLKPINTAWINGVNEDDVSAYILASCGRMAESRALSERLLPSLRKYGNLRLLADAVELAQSNADDNDATIDADLIEAAVLKLCPKERD